LTQEEVSILTQGSQQKFIKLEVYDINNNQLDSIEGNLIGGSLSIDSTSSIRRSLSSLNFVITDPLYLPSYNGLFWINTKIRVAVGIKSLFTGEIIYFHLGWYLFDKPDVKLSQTAYEITISGIDYMANLNGQRGGYLSNAVKTEISIASPISAMMRLALSDAGISDYMIEDVCDTSGNILTTPTVIDVANTDTTYTLIDKLANIYEDGEYFYSIGTETSQPIFIYQGIKDRTEDGITFNFEENNTIIDIDNQPNFDNPKNDIWIYGNSNTNYAPSGLALVSAVGTLSANVYSYCVTGVLSTGETTPCLEESITLSGGQGVKLSWNALTDPISANIVNYNIYGRTSGGELYIGTTTLVTFTDDGSITPTTAMPTGQAMAHIQNNNINSPFSIGNLGKTLTYSETESTFSTNSQCLSRAQKILWLRSYLAESVNFTSVPLFPLDVNQVVYINKPNAGVIGNYLVNKISYDLKETGVMTIDCSRVYKYQNDATTWN